MNKILKCGAHGFGLVYPAYTGFVATRGLQPDTLNATNRQAMSRSTHYTRTDVTSFKIIVPNWYINGSLNETGSGSAMSVTGSIEYPVGVFTQVLFSGGATGSVPNNSYLISDTITVTIPTDTQFWIRLYATSTTGIIYSSAQPNTLGQFEMGVSGITDRTMGGSISNLGNAFAPVAIIGTTTKPSFLLIGDSIMYGVADSSSPNGFADIGPYARAVGPTYGYSKLARTSDTAAKFVSGHTNRGTLFQYATHVICNYGSNDLFVSSRTDVQLKADLATIAGYSTSLGTAGPTYFATIAPRTQSSDSWATLGNQSQSNGTAEGYRVSVNQHLRAGLVGSRTFNTASAVETSQDSGFWKSPSYTADGTHPSSAAIVLMLNEISLP